GIFLIIAALFASDVFNMQTLNFLLTNVAQVGIIGLVIVFQTELRSVLEKMGGRSIIGTLNKRYSEKVESLECIDNVVAACEDFSKDKTGALLVFERYTKLGDVIRTGTVINSDPAVYLIKNIFYNKAPLHDGALVIRDFKLCSAGCFLPLSQNENIVKDLGTRHRAAIGMSENSDAVVVVVSEETGTISLAINGVLTRGYDSKSLKDALVKFLIKEDNSKSSHTFKKIGKNAKSNS
ncbi:MAG: diadenylate cyclase CdaA, partial [Clostridia bacterium]|nr:diadenylate cyclase CdaA [Clostridia bacterium]